MNVKSIIPDQLILIISDGNKSIKAYFICGSSGQNREKGVNDGDCSEAIIQNSIEMPVVPSNVRFGERINSPTPRNEAAYPGPTSLGRNQL
jgi:hypothetical protein